MTERDSSEFEQKPTEATPQQTIQDILKNYLKPEDLNRPPSREWTTLRSEQIISYGENSIAGLLPEGLSGYAAIMASRVINALRLNGRIKTSEELLKTSQEELLKVNGIGNRSIPLIIAMKDLAAQREVERN